MIRLALLLVLVSAAVVSAQDTTVHRDANLNASSEAYALSFRMLETSMEAWLTVSPEGDPNRRLLARSTCTADGFGRAEVIMDAALNPEGTTYNGVPTFNPCDPNEAVIVSDRSSRDESRHSNDLYLIRQSGGSWSATRMSINSGAWDDTPAFGVDGNTLYFASDRRRPGSGAADLYMSRRVGGRWSEPVLLQSICSANDHESSPFVTADGILMFTSNRNGDQDIRTVRLDDQGMPKGDAATLAETGVNQPGSDEYHPMISPGGNWLIFASNRGDEAGSPFRLYYKRLNADPVALKLTVTARTKVKDATKLQYFGKLDSIYNVQTKIELTDLPDGRQQVLETDASGSTVLTFAPSDVKGPWRDTRTRTIVARPWEHERGYRAGIDTVIIDLQYCDRELEHTLYLDDTASKSTTCEFTFRTFNVPFFVTAYWCPTTNKYRQYTPCTSLFTDDMACEDLQQPEHCETNEAYRYEFIPAKLVRTNRRGENCVNYAEFEKNGPDWADEVDANIERMRNEVGAALNESCIQEAIRRGHKVTITYVGTTDDRGINTKCKYTGQAYDEIQALAPDIEISQEIAPFITTGQRFNAGGYGGRAGGNQLLSDLRSLYFAILFDNLCKETIPVYRELRNSGMMVVKSRGEAIDTRDLPYEVKRAAGVEISVPDFEVIAEGLKAAPTRTVRLCPEGPCR